MENKISDRARLLKLIDGQPNAAPAGPENPATPVDLPEKAYSALTKLKGRYGPRVLSGFHRLGLDKKEGVLLILVCVAVLFFLVPRFFKGKKVVPAPAAAAQVSAPPDTVQPSRLPPEEAGPRIGIRLVGVDWGEVPVALVEDTGTGRTYFVKENDKILGSRVKSIEKDRVLVSYRGQNVELR